MRNPVVQVNQHWDFDTPSHKKSIVHEVAKTRHNDTCYTNKKRSSTVREAL